MCVIVGVLASAASNVTCVMEDCGVGIVLAYRLVTALTVVLVNLHLVEIHMLGIVDIASLFAEGLDAFVAVAGTWRGNIKENSAGIVSLHYLLDLCNEVVKVGCIVAKAMITRLLGKVWTCIGSRSLEMVHMLAGILFVKTCGKVNGSVYADLAASLKHCARKVEAVQLRMYLVSLGGVVSPAVMAFGEDGNRVHVTCLQSLLELLFVELIAH